MAKEKLIIFDTTMRDGEQSPGASMTKDDKLRIARQLERMRVDVIEAGFPAASDGDFESVQAVARAIKDSTVCGLARANEQDIRRCGEAVQVAAQPRIHTFIATSPIHMEKKLRMEPSQVIDQAVRAIKWARGYTDNVEFSPEDAGRSDLDFLCRILEQVIKAGARTINVPDTVGYTLPDQFGRLIRNLRERIPNSDQAIWSVHCHNDLGLAVANSLSAVQNGARQVECTINGLGERAGNAALEEIVMAVRTRQDLFDCDTAIDATQIVPASKLVSGITGYPVQPNKAIVGANAFAHESGIHQHGVLNERTTYEIMDPAAVGQGESKIVLGKHSGRHAFADTLDKMGIKISGDALNQAFLRFKELADRKIQLSEADLEAIVAEELGADDTDRWEVVAIAATVAPGERPSATVTLSRAGERFEQACDGDGMIDACCSAIRKVTGMDGELDDYAVTSVTGGVDALADVVLKFTSTDGITVAGRGLSTDVVEASARAFLNAINKVAKVRMRGGD
ncbi:MAG: 2-isopropylmalate synthase, partial [Burkholderiales bacterium]|nr:2-isopropylmalate synthase [Burkholderiales bacterium]